MFFNKLLDVEQERVTGCMEKSRGPEGEEGPGITCPGTLKEKRVPGRRTESAERPHPQNL